MNKNNQIKNILLTGATGGLGVEIAQLLLTMGYAVTNLGRLQTPTNRMFRNHQNYTTIVHDFSRKTDASEWRTIIGDPKQYAHCIIIHGNFISKPILDLRSEDIETSMQINFIGPFSLCQYLLSAWKKTSTDNSITYISSVAVFGGAPDEVAYHTSKRAMQGGMLSIARAFAHPHIRANVISPGLMNTPLGKKTLQRRPDVLTRIPLQKLTKTKDVARMAITLMLSPTITGQNIHINAGRYATL